MRNCPLVFKSIFFQTVPFNSHRGTDAISFLVASLSWDFPIGWFQIPVTLAVYHDSTTPPLLLFYIHIFFRRFNWSFCSTRWPSFLPRSPPKYYNLGNCSIFLKMLHFFKILFSIKAAFLKNDNYRMISWDTTRVCRGEWSTF